MTRDLLAEVSARFAAQGLMRTLGVKIDHVEPGLVRLSADVTEASSQHHGHGHAGLTFALSDTAAGFAAWTLMDPGHEVVTSEFRISLLAPATGRLVATGRVIRPGRRLMAVAADLHAGDTHVATSLGTMVPISS
jgi:uncharacterized protein (TIGR00369 family)